ncbi:MAG: glycine zipper 2TM domain-containing protein [gamma proteobacterium symbiont of Clathrolucina costata]|uniref:Glycine zipper 2TM domain-containing protein n=1 Tax=Candidatus Thiodiazotropha taylori TaxID=2792791 RepID=A0A9E4TV63_9GAMM|nr:glycine zipper 2TM domain-containing protein [Candidatus Thiodiazotropha sp. (ex Codakia orbicularis)]MBT3092403.1 glycine zipper 2TM domain-containing protein [Candidatus Thiodiazotropha sp. (ex Lucina pensylvanica)]MCG7980562.1 glycine zipper 2TM domain-containing protein [Candidatus Thiodiazotropha taylori]MCG8024948.1 glycine zipper 2TM domain-containing protein [Candidatus Thiodiazotropha endolucinida]MCW4238702.1 glycine zipper 2TM domain-containing protein [Candidatus Thiodiazotropha 
MKTEALTIGTALMIASMAATAGQRDYFHDTAKVIDVEPIYRSVEVSYPERECWDQEVDRYHPDGRRYTGTVLGGIIGGVVANKISRGRGRGRDAATLAGTLLGGAIGHDISQQHRGGHHTTSVERRCEVTHHTRYEEQLIGYDVTYRYKGREFTTRTNNHPGKRIPVAITVRPVGDD